MLKNFIQFAPRKMSSDKKTKKTLAKKLSDKKCLTEFEQADNKSNLFKNAKNKRGKTTESKEKEARVKLENIKKPKVFSMNTEEHVKLLRSGKEKVGAEKEIELSIETIKTKLVKSPKKINTHKSRIQENLEPSTSKKIKQELSSEWKPSNWEAMLENIRNMRSKDDAPVDTMGCHKCADKNADKKTQRFHKLIALMLSSQTKDETTYHAMLRLREQNLTPEVICNMKLNTLQNILHPVSFYKNKAKYMQQTSKILVEKYNSDIPNNIKELVALPGVGPKMAHICMATAWHEITGIGVDVHVHRISNRMAWLPKPTKDPEQTRLALENWLPKHLWSEVNHLLVGFGQTTCTPVKPKCTECLNFEICPSATKIKK